MPRNDNINKHLSAAPSFTLKSFPAEKRERSCSEMEGKSVDEYLITIFLNKCFSQTYPLDIPTVLL